MFWEVVLSDSNFEDEATEAKKATKEKNKLEDINLALEDYSIKIKNPAFNNKILYASTTDSNPLVKRHDFKGKIDKRAWHKGDSGSRECQDGR